MVGSYFQSSGLVLMMTLLPLENGAEKRREIPNVVPEFFDELSVTDEEENFDNIQDITYRIRRRLV